MKPSQLKKGVIHERDCYVPKKVIIRKLND
jgi:hypothetical protein